MFFGAILEASSIHSAVDRIVNSSPQLLSVYCATYQAFNYFIIPHWAQLKHNGLYCSKTQPFSACRKGSVVVAFSIILAFLIITAEYNTDFYIKKKLALLQSHI